MNADKLGKIFDRTTKSQKIHTAAVLVENTAGDIRWKKGYGGKDIDSPIIIASITKLFMTTCILVLIEQGKLSLEDKISKYVGKDILDGLHVYKGKEYAYELTISDLLFQVSGLPDYFFEGDNPFDKKIKQEDFFVSFEEMVDISKKMKPNFAPRKKGRGYYADLNFDLLGKVVENIAAITISEAYERYIITPLDLKSTYTVKSEDDYVPDVYCKNTILRPVKFLSSCPASGGVISTCRELMLFLKAFWGGRLFNKKVFDRLQQYNKLQILLGPIRYGGGHMKVDVGYPFLRKIELVGHSGSTGSFAFYCPKKDLYFVGDVNQISSPAIPIRLVMQLAMKA